MHHSRGHHAQRPMHTRLLQVEALQTQHIPPLRVHHCHRRLAQHPLSLRRAVRARVVRALASRQRLPHTQLQPGGLRPLHQSHHERLPLQSLLLLLQLGDARLRVAHGGRVARALARHQVHHTEQTRRAQSSPLRAHEHIRRRPRAQSVRLDARPLHQAPVVLESHAPMRTPGHVQRLGGSGRGTRHADGHCPQQQQRHCISNSNSNSNSNGLGRYQAARTDRVQCEHVRSGAHAHSVRVAVLVRVALQLAHHTQLQEDQAQRLLGRSVPQQDQLVRVHSVRPGKSFLVSLAHSFNNKTSNTTTYSTVQSV